MGLEAFKVGQIVRAFVKSIQAFGVFLRIEDSRISGLCHRSEVRDNAGEDWAKEVRLGDDVSALITEIDLEKQRISFSMRKSRIHKASDAITAAREENGSEVDTDDGADDDLDIILDAQRAAEEASESEESDVDLARDAEADSDQEDTEMGPVSFRAFSFFDCNPLISPSKPVTLASFDFSLGSQHWFLLQLARFGRCRRQSRQRRRRGSGRHDLHRACSLHQQVVGQPQLDKLC